VSELHDDADVLAIEASIDGWLADARAANPLIEAVDRGEPGTLRWYVRLRGDAKDHTTIWMTVGQRTLQYEAYVLPMPEENAAAVHEMVLRHNHSLVGAHFAIGVEDAIFLRGELPLGALDADELDRIIGSIYAYVERFFPALIGLAFASRFR
jgi:Putative bacterial sensory transduction regulator